MAPPLPQMRLAHHIPAKGLVGAIPGNAVRVIDAPYRGLDSQPRQSMATQSPISQRFTPRVITFAQKPWPFLLGILPVIQNILHINHSLDSNLALPRSLRRHIFFDTWDIVYLTIHAPAF